MSNGLPLSPSNNPPLFFSSSPLLLSSSSPLFLLSSSPLLLLSSSSPPLLPLLFSPPLLLSSSPPPLLFLSSSPLLQAEKQRADLTKELEDLQDKLEEQGGATAAQVSATMSHSKNCCKLAHTQTILARPKVVLLCIIA